MSRFDSAGFDGSADRRLRTAGAVAAVVVLLYAGPLRAGAGDMSLHLGAQLANANGAASAGPQFGVAVRGTAVVDVSSFWSLQFGGAMGHHFPAKPGSRQLPAMGVRHAYAGFRYNLDVFTYVPYVGLSAAAYLPGPPVRPGVPARSTVGAILTVGVDWRFDRYWSLGVVADLHSVGLGAGAFPNYSSVGVQFGYHFRL